MLRLALEIPTSQLERFAPLVDLDFILAHKVLADAEYARFFYNRPEGRELILDNSTHEFGKPLPMEDLRTAAEQCRADLVIAPDIVPPDKPISGVQYWQNIEWMKEASHALHPYEVAAVLCGTTEEQRDVYVAEAAGRVAAMCFTFHEPNRLQWWRHFSQKDKGGLILWDRIHILGVSTLSEVREWVKISNDFPGVDFSIDTTKPVKWGAQLRHIDDMNNLRGGPIDAKAVLELSKFTDEQVECTEHNINFMMALCRGEV